MKNKKYGFTLAEVLITVVIIGVIMALSVNSIKIVKASYTSLAYFAFNNVKAMVGVLFTGSETGSITTIVKVDNQGNVVQTNVRPQECNDESNGKCVHYMTDTYTNPLRDNDDNALPSVVTQCRKDGVVVQVFKSDSTSTGDHADNMKDCSNRATFVGGTGTNFCKSLAAISNVSGQINCDTLSSVAFDGTEPSISDFDYDNPNFIATNGQRYYISQWDFNANVSDTYGYRLIAIDLNGKSRPNKIDASSTTPPPDIITFMVLDNGEVLPLGVAADNIHLQNGRVVQYLNSKVKGYYYDYYQDFGHGGEDGSPATPTAFNRSDDVIAPECKMTRLKEDGTREPYQTCNYAVVYLQNESPSNVTEGTDSEGSTSNANRTSFFSYREAYCTALGQNGTSVYPDYCEGVTRNEYCPPTNSTNNERPFDLCLPTTVKPMFRYNFK